MNCRPISDTHRAGIPRVTLTGHLRRTLAMTLATALVIAPLPGAALERGSTPLEVDVSPSSTAVGGVITISGRSVILGDNQRIPIQIARPDGTQRDLTAALDKAQSFRQSFAETSIAGNYRVTVFTADRRASVEASFTVQAPAAFRREATERMTAAFQELEEETDEFSETIREAPASVARDELEERVDGLRVLLADVDKYFELLDQSVEALEEAVEEDDEDKPDGKPDPKPKPEDAPDAGPEPEGATKPDGKPDPKPKPETAPDAGPEPDSADKPDGKPTEPAPDSTGRDSPPGEGSAEPAEVGSGAHTGDPAEVGSGAYTGDPADVGSGAYTGEGDPRSRKVNPSGVKPGEEDSSAEGAAGSEGDGGAGADAGGDGDAGGGTHTGGSGSGAQQARQDVAELHEEMGRAADEIEKAQKLFSEQLEKFDYDHTLCDGLHYVQQAWTSMTAAISAAKKLTQVALGKAGKVATELAADEGRSALVGSAGGTSPEASLARGQLVATAKAQATDSLSRFSVLENGANGLMEYGLERIFRLVCEKYVGPFKGTMTAEVFVEQGRFYAYETKIEGELRLRYERGSRGVQPVTGEFEGVATSFKLDEDLWRIQPTVKRDVLLRWVMHPIASFYAGSVGTFGRALLSPNYFYVPVRGVIEGDTIQIQLQPATQDFEKSSTAVYVLINLSVPFPHVMTQEIPHEGANYILTRALRDDPQFKIVVHRDEEYSDVTESFQHDANTPDNLIKVRTQVEVRACNPECPGG